MKTYRLNPHDRSAAALECGGKRSATPPSEGRALIAIYARPAQRWCRRFALPPHSKVFAAALAFILFSLASSHAGTLTVINLDDSGAGSLRQAIANSGSGETITFAPGLEGTIVLQSELAIQFKDLTIQSLNGHVAVSGDHFWKIFIVNQCNATLIGLRIMDSGDSYIGFYNGFDPTGLGGGLYSFLANVTLRDCSFSGNRANFGGVIYQDAGGQLNVFNCTISGQLALSQRRRGRDRRDRGSVDREQHHRRQHRNGDLDFRKLHASEFHRRGKFEWARHGPSDISGTVTSASHNLIGDAATAGGIVDGTNGNIVGNNGTGTIDLATVLNPVLADNGGTTLSHMLVPGSPALDAGDNSLAPDSTDQRGAGFVRIFNGTVDMGSIEARPGVPARFEFVTQPAGGMANFPLAPTVSVRVLDDFGQLVTNSPVTISLSVMDPIDPDVGSGQFYYHLELAATRARENLRLFTSGPLARAISAPFATTISPVLNTNNAGPGSLRAMIEDSHAGDVITFQPGVSGTINFAPIPPPAPGSPPTYYAGFFIFHPLTVIGPGVGLLTIDAHELGGGFLLLSFDPEPFACTISGLTITNATGISYDFLGGGAITAYDVDLTLNDCVITGNRWTNDEDEGGGSGGVNVVSRFDAGPRMLTLTRCIITDNIGSFEAGGVLAETLQATDCTVAGNNGSTGGIRADNATVEGCTVSSNTGNDIEPGGIWANSLSLRNSTVSQNTGENGGGIFSNNATITSSTIVANHARAFGGGIVSGGLTLSNTIVAGNTAGPNSNNDDISGNATATYSLIGDAATSGGITDGVNGNIVGNGGAGTLPLDSVLNPTLADNGGATLTHALIAGSLALDAGISAGLTSDQRGFPRPFDLPGVPNASDGDGSDMGACETGALQLAGAVSRKTHGIAGDFDLNWARRPTCSLKCSQPPR